MKAPQTSGGKDFEKHPTGAYAAVCTRIINIGTHWNQKKEKDENKIMLFFESVKLMTEGEYKGQPMLLVSNFNFSMYKNSMLCQFIEQWLGKSLTQEEANEFDLDVLLGKAGFVSVVHNGDYVNIGSIMPMPDGMAEPKAVGDLIVYDPITNNLEMRDKLSDKMQARIKDCKELNQPQVPESENPAPQSSGDDFSDEIPF